MASKVPFRTPEEQLLDRYRTGLWSFSVGMWTGETAMLRLMT
jgi:hypothetical protein